MPARRRTDSDSEVSHRRPATTSASRESQLISLAMDLAERQLSDGTASAQVISNFLKLGSSREKLEQARLEGENVLLAAKAENLESQGRIEVLYADAITAMRAYSGQEPLTSPDEYDD